MKKQPMVSVVIPAYNAGKFLERCLDAVLSSSYPSFEVIVVNDGSTDATVDICRKRSVTVVDMPRRSGPAAARNYGVRRASGDIVFFIDADVVAPADAMARVAADFENNPDLAAVFGSYDDEPAEQNFLSQYKNIFHHFVHQKANTEAATFWAGCGAVDRKIFELVGGFDAVRYAQPSIEDIELGYRLRSRGYRILLDKNLQAKHLKEWRMGSLLRTDIFCRAVPWTRLILERQEKVNDLNLKTADRISGALAGLLVVVLAASLANRMLLYATPLLLLAFASLNLALYRYFFERKGLLFTLRAFVMHLIYYLYSDAAFALCWCERFRRAPIGGAGNSD